MMNIYDNPLTIKNLANYIDEAVSRAFDPVDAYQQTLHMAVRNCIWVNNIDCLHKIFAEYPNIALNRTYGRGSLLCYAASTPLLAQGPEKLGSLMPLLEQGADPLISQNYYLLIEHYRGAGIARKGNFMSYINDVSYGLRHDRAVQITTSDRTEIAYKSVDYVKSVLDRFYPNKDLNLELLTSVSSAPKTADSLKACERDLMAVVCDEIRASREHPLKPFVDLRAKAQGFTH